MMKEKSSGAIIFREDGRVRKYLVLKYGYGHWDFPRGKIEEGESEEDAAIREIREETGITEIKFMDGFKESSEWVYSKGKEKVEKTVILFLVETVSDQVKLSSEHSDYK